MNECVCNHTCDDGFCDKSGIDNFRLKFRSRAGLSVGAGERLEQNKTVRLTELVSALSYALNLTASLVPGHGVRCAEIARRIGRHRGLAEDVLDDLYYLALLKDIGCSANSSRVAEIFMADDIALKHDIKMANATLRDGLALVGKHIGKGESPVVRLGRLAMVLARRGEFLKEIYDTRCLRGAEIVRGLRFSPAVEQGILHLNEHWDGSGQPNQIKGEAISVLSRITLLAQIADVFFIAFGPERAIREVRLRAGKVLDPALVADFEAVADAALWQRLADPELDEKLADEVYEGHPAPVDDRYLDDIAGAFSQVIDAKSSFTAGHSQRVARLAQQLCEELGHGGDAQRQAWRAGLLHDIGKLGVSSLILDKPGSLNEAEYAAVRDHAKMGEDLLSRVTVLQPLAMIIGGHHEMLDGTGYPRGVREDQIGPLTRVLTVADIFDALTSERPYRPALPVRRAVEIMDAEMGRGLDGACFGALKTLIGKGLSVSRATP